MKINYAILTVLLIAVVSYIACNENYEGVALKPEAAKTSQWDNIVGSYNADLAKVFGTAVPDIKKGFVADGELVSRREVDADGKSLAILFTSPSFEKMIQFDFGLSKALDFPESIEKAQVVFIGRQLIVIDRASDFIVNLYVPNDVAINKTPELTTANGSMLRIATRMSGEYRSGNECACDCVNCFPINNCTTAACSCTCPSGDSCSVTCVSGKEAQCTKNCSDEQ